jgi:thiol-disulfide isomerase/thioredoxin
MTQPPAASSKTRRRTLFAGAAVAAIAAAGFAGVYGIGGGIARGDADCAGAVEAANRARPFARGDLAALSLAESSKKLPDLAFTDAEGKPRHLSEWRGKTVLLNLWATWCVPCRKEMPALDALAGEMRGDATNGAASGNAPFDVVAVNIDTRDLDKPKSWLEDIGVTHLAYFADPQAKVFQELKAIGRAFGMPTTLLVDPKGCEIGYLAGPAEWAGEDALKLVRAAVGEKAAE